MDINQIDETIKELESRDATFDICNKLASLYIVRDKLTETRQIQEEEPRTYILPQYENYVQNKRKYQRNEIPSDGLHSCMTLLCLELSDFVHGLYSSCDTMEEQTELRNTIDSLHLFLLK